MPAIVLNLEGETLRIDQANPRIYIGRDPRVCDLVAPPTVTSVSRRHAEIFMRGDDFFLRDLGSSNGTWVDGKGLDATPLKLASGQQVFIGHSALSVEWEDGAVGATVMGKMPAILRQKVDARARNSQAMLAAVGQPVAAISPFPRSISVNMPARVSPKATAEPKASPAPSAAAPTGTAALGLGGAASPLTEEFAYRRQGSNSNGALLIALKSDTFANDGVIEGFLEFTAMDNETIASIVVDLVECHRKGPRRGHVWDRMLVRQGPWRASKGDVLPMPFKLRIPPGTSPSGHEVHWELRGYVDINWAFDIEANSPITMRNTDLERVRDALGRLDYRISDIVPQPLGQSFEGRFQPPAQLAEELGIQHIGLSIEYLGLNIKIKMKVAKSSMFQSNRQTELVFELKRFREATLDDLSSHFAQEIDLMMT